MIEKKELIYDKLPFTVYHDTSIEVKPLLFFFHGFTSERQKGIMGRGEVLAQKGFYVVALDAYLHGERRKDNFDKLSIELKWKRFFNIVIHTALDAKSIYENYLSQMKEIKKDKVYAFGVSMGASISFYLATLMTNLKTIVSIVGSPSFYDFYQYIQNVYKFAKDKEYNDNLKLYKKICPLINYQKLVGKKIFMSCGKRDKVVPATYAFELAKKLSTKDVLCKDYDTEHLSTNKMHLDAYQFLLNN